MLRKMTIALLFVFVVAVLFSVSAEEAEKPEDAIRELPTLTTSVVRFPQLGYIIVPKSALSLDIETEQACSNYEVHKFVDMLTLGESLRTTDRGFIDVSDLVGEKLFFLIHYNMSEKLQVKSFRFLNANNEPIKPNIRRHVLGWFEYPWGGGTMLIRSFSPILGAQVQMKRDPDAKVYERDWKGFESDDTYSGKERLFKIERVSPFAIRVNLNSFADKECRVCVLLDLDSDYKIGGVLYYWSESLARMHGINLHIPKWKQGRPLTKMVIPLNTGKIDILVDRKIVLHSPPYYSFSLFLNDDAKGQWLDFKNIRPSFEAVEETIDGNVHKFNRISANFKLNDSALELLKTAKEGQLKLYMNFSVDPFFCGDIESEIIKLIYTVRFYDAEGKLLADWARDGVDFKTPR